MKYEPDTLHRINRRALAQMVAMIHAANHRDDAAEGDPKVGGHPAACASSLEILAALHLVVRRPEDYLCAKPHAAPMDHAFHHLLGLNRHRDGRWFDREESMAVMRRLRAYPRDGEPVYQSYHSEFDPDSWRYLPSGSVGIPPVVSAYLSLAYRYARAHGFELERPHFWSLIGDSEFREGSLLEVLPEVAERQLGDVTWIVDYNRQSLDGARTPNNKSLAGTDADRIEKTCVANGWRVIQLRHGKYREGLFRRPGGEALRSALERRLTDFQVQTLLWKRDAGAIRRALAGGDPDCAELIDSLADEEIVRALLDLGGHDLEALAAAMSESKRDPDVPTMIVAHTLKGNRLRCAAATGNHSALPDEDEVEELLRASGLTMEAPFEPFAAGTAEGEFLAARGAELREGIEVLERDKQARLAGLAARLEDVGGVPPSLNVNLKLAPLAHTQWMWGQLAAKLIRIGVHAELSAAGKPAGRDLTPDERPWDAFADLVMTMAPDVGTSTNINPAMDEKVFGPDFERDWEKELEIRERLRPQLTPSDAAWSRHIRFDIAEANCMSAAGAFGKLGHYAGVPFLPMMTVYDFFIKRALDQLYYNLYWGSGFVLVGTPSGVTLAPEGAQHSWKSDIQIPNLVTWEPSFARELDWILCDAVRRHLTGDNDGRRGVLIRAVTRGLPQRLLLENLRRQARFKSGLPAGAELAATPGSGGLAEAEVPALDEADILAAVRADVLRGGYWLVDYRGYRGYRPGENVVHVVTMGALAPEAVDASNRLLERGIYANVLIASSPDLLCGLLGHRDGYRHLREGLGVDGDLHLAADGTALDALDAVDLAGRRIPIVSVHDGEEGLLDNLGSIAGVKQIALAVRRFSKSGTPADVFALHGLDAGSIDDACGRALAETALERVRLTRAAFDVVERQQRVPQPDWRDLWPSRA